ncbi:hypothetical protein Q5H80_20405 [Vibrio sp. SNU_ST1]|uniref:hypothetical protein n=1 Tax=Vibrio sp. SNU_ST1 TaxID=3064001 RepID=UPI00272A3D86|nr:hypothetical protein [Vibrio sp. SNU_ST1]WKY59919.1 hypothetical protein Q5H80_20405 [Vibrio sp. SNU_ST1]
MTKILLPLVLGVSSITTIAHANENINLQGYYKSKAAIKFAVDKIQQNKIEFMNLDEAFSLIPGSSPQTLASIDDLANGKSVHADVFLAKAKEFKLNNKVCVISKDGATIAYEADGVATCNFDLNKVHKAMAKTSKELIFFKRYGTGNDTQYTIDKISLNGQEVSNTFLYTSKGKLLGDIAKVKKDSAGKYTIEHYVDSGPEDGTKIGYRAYQWANDFSDGQKVTINSLSYQYGSTVELKKQKTPFHWAIKDYVSPSNANGDFYFSSVVSRLARSVDNKITQKDMYSKQAPSDLIAYNFNNANKLVGLSPDACTIKQIADGKTTVTWYTGLNRGKDCSATAADIAGKKKVTTSTLTNDGSKKVSVASLQKSASDILQAVELDSTSASDLTDAEFAAMKAKYDAATKQYKDFNSIQFWK